MLNIITKRTYAYIFSAILVVASIAALFVWGLKLGIDFKGGTLMNVQFSRDYAVEDIRASVADIDVESLTIQKSDGNTALLRYIASDELQNQSVLAGLMTLDPNAAQLSVDFIGASISEQLKDGAFRAIIFAVIAILCYIAWAFRKVSFPVASWYYGAGAVVALFHDVLITLGVFAALGHFLDVEIGIPFVAALLTILGYSVNDTIVIYDRIRENLLRTQKEIRFEEVVNRSLNESLGRSFNTSITVIVVLLAIIFFGGTALTWFAVALLIGVIFGTYSSIFIATALIVTMYKLKRADKVDM